MVVRMVLNSLTWLNLGMYSANTQGSLPRSPPLKEVLPGTLDAPPVLSSQPLHAAASSWSWAVAAWSQSMDRASPHPSENTRPMLPVSFLGYRTFFLLCLNLQSVPWLGHTHSHTHPEISPLQSCTWHTLLRHTKALLSGPQLHVVKSCKCRILSNITIAMEET